ncbi:MAG: hypothetical protein HUU26_00500 [Gemmatimonadaceae bacterium]|nr:hypothetical protein [Phycisphaerae bacterium]NUQ10797.1 hypothetical protein [Gemmatimonadaceae bacterium]
MTTKTRNWPATHAFVAEARSVEQILEAALRTVRELRHDELTRSGERTQTHVEVMNAVLGHVQLLCEALAPLDGGRLVREQL